MNEFKNKKFRHESKIDWHSNSGISQLIYNYKVQRNEVLSFDGIFPWNFKEEHYVNLQQKSNFVYGDLEGLISGVMIELSLDKKVSYRRVYSLLEWLGEIGGFFTVLNAACLFMVAMFSPWDWEKYLVRKLYKR